MKRVRIFMDCLLYPSFMFCYEDKLVIVMKHSEFFAPLPVLVSKFLHLGLHVCALLLNSGSCLRAVDQGKAKVPKIFESAIPVRIPVVEEINEAKMRTKLRSSTLSKFFSLLLVILMIAFDVSSTDSPLAEVNEADSSENDLELGQHELETEKVSLVLLAEGNEYSDSSERDLDQGHLTASYLQLGLAETTISFDSVLESVNHINTESLSFVEGHSAFEDAQSLEMLQRSPIERNGGNFGAFHILGISSSSLVLGLLAATVLQLYLKRRSDKVTLHPVDEVAKHNVVKEKEHSSQNWPTEVDIAREYSCNSEMSCSFQMSSTYREKYPESVNDEAQSIEKKHRKCNRREPLTASDEYSIDSPSYGSITTYERIPGKHESGREEVIIPVRRSSRIRSHVPSSTFRF